MEDHHKYCVGFEPDDIVVCGMSCKLPGSRNIEEYEEGLYSMRQMITYEPIRFAKGLIVRSVSVPMDSPGCLPDLEKFDAGFFQMKDEDVDAMNLPARNLLEVVYEAMLDAGFDPTVELRGHKVGVYHAQVTDDSAQIPLIQQHDVHLRSRSQIPNTISWFYDWRGPSHSVDSACSSSGGSMHRAVCDLKSGQVEVAVVTACQLNMDPHFLLGFIASGICTATGNAVPFDSRSDGMIRTEGITSVVMMRADRARRAYAKVCVINANSAGYVPEGISVPCLARQVELCRDAIAATGITPDDIQYCEAHGTGTLVGDPIEINAIDNVYSHPGRKDPIYVSTVKGNIGHTEANSMVAGLIKVCLIFENSLIPPQYDFQEPNPYCTPIIEGRVCVPKTSVPLTSPYIPINSMGFGGTIHFSVLKQNLNTPEGRPQVKTDIPRLVLFGSTTNEGVQSMFDFVKNRSDELRDEFYALVNKLIYTPIKYKPIRGYCLLADPKKAH